MIYYVYEMRDGQFLLDMCEHLQHHSIAQVLLDFLQLSRNDLLENDVPEYSYPEDCESKTERLMKEKNGEVINLLLKQLWRHNDDFEHTLNAHMILQEMASSVSGYVMLVQE